MVLTLDGHGPRYGQIARALVALIRRGGLTPGGRAPSTRELAQDAGCSRNVVLLAYEQLLIEGYFVSQPRTGTFVAPDLPAGVYARGADTRGTLEMAAVSGARDEAHPPAAHARLSRHGRGLMRATAGAMAPFREEASPIDFMYGLSEPDDRLARRLRSALADAIKTRAFSYGTAAGDAGLRDQIALRLRLARGISCTADQIVLTSGTQQALDICARLLIDPGDTAVVEDPGYEVARAEFVAAGARVVSVTVDRDGLDPARLPGGGRPPRLVYVTPSHQFPTGAVLSAARRYALVEWARRARAYVFEDDYDGEFRYAAQPIPALASLDHHVVIYCGTFAKSLFPSCRIGYLVLPSALIDPATRGKWLSDRSNSRLIEHALSHLLATGEYDRHIRRMQRRYRERRDTLVRSLRHHLGANVAIEGSSAGLHLVAWLPELPSHRVEDLVAGCRASGVGVYPLARHAVGPLERAGLVLGYGLTEVGVIDQGVRGLADVYRRLIR